MPNPTTYRRLQASVTRLADKQRGITDPLFNLREIAKQLILLEDHLGHENKRCPDCIQKHLLTIEALAEEAVSLDQSGKVTAISNSFAEEARNWLQAFLDGTDPKTLAETIRRVRKLLTPAVCDPREPINRVASVYWARQQCSYPA